MSCAAAPRRLAFANALSNAGARIAKRARAPSRAMRPEERLGGRPSPGPDDRSAATTPARRLARRLVALVVSPEATLVACAAVWGGYHPCMRAILASRDGDAAPPPSPAEINLARFALTAAMCVAHRAVLVAARSRWRSDASSSEEGGSGERNLAAAFFGRGASPSLLRASLELALWHALTIGFQSCGVRYQSATRAGFVSSTTTMMVPAVAWFAGARATPRTRLAALVCVVGTVLVVAARDGTGDPRDGDGIGDPRDGDGTGTVFSLGTTRARRSPPAFSSGAFSSVSDDAFKGDASTLAGAFFRAVCLVRLSKLAPRHALVDLVTARAVAIALFVAAWFAAERAFEGEGWSGSGSSGSGSSAMDPAWRWTTSRSAAASRARRLVLFMAVGPGYACAWMQAIAQAKVSASRAGVILATTPLWGAAWARASMGSREATAPIGWVGGGIVVLGAALVAGEARKEGSQGRKEGGRGAINKGRLEGEEAGGEEDALLL